MCHECSFPFDDLFTVTMIRNCKGESSESGRDRRADRVEDLLGRDTRGAVTVARVRGSLQGHALDASRGNVRCGTHGLG